MPTSEVTSEPRPLKAVDRSRQTGPLIVVVESVCAAAVAAFLVTGSPAVTVTVAVAAVSSLAVAREGG